jgi:hypothetical protein
MRHKRRGRKRPSRSRMLSTRCVLVAVAINGETLQLIECSYKRQSFSDLFVEFLLKEAAQGQKPSPATNPQSALPSPGLAGASSPTIGNPGLFGRQRTYSNSSMTSNVSGSFSRPNFAHYSQQNPNGNMNLNLNLGSGVRSPQYMGGMARKGSFSAQHMISGTAVMDRDGYTSPRGSISGPSWRN